MILPGAEHRTEEPHFFILSSRFIYFVIKIRLDYMGWPLARLFGWSACDWPSPANSKSISSNTSMKTVLSYCNQKQLEHELVVWGMIAPLRNHQQIDWTSGHTCTGEHTTSHPCTSREHAPHLVSEHNHNGHIKVKSQSSKLLFQPWVCVLLIGNTFKDKLLLIPAMEHLVRHAILI